MSCNCQKTPYNQRRIMLTQQRVNVTEGSDSVTLYAPPGYRVVSGGWSAATPENIQILQSTPEAGSDITTGSANPEAWFFNWAVTGEGSTSLSFAVICEYDPYETVVAGIPYGM